jgi:hypothetical protein
LGFGFKRFENMPPPPPQALACAQQPRAVVRRNGISKLKRALFRCKQG